MASLTTPTLWTPDQAKALAAVRKLAELEMNQAFDLCPNCHDKFVIAKTYHFVYKKGMNKEVARQLRNIARREDPLI